MNTSETPRTDGEEFFLPPEAANCIAPPQNDGVVESIFARTLERELAEAKAEVAELREDRVRLAMLDDPFLFAMQAELLANRHKGNWSEFVISQSDAAPWLQEHVDKLGEAISSANQCGVREHSADVANIAMKIYKCLGEYDAARKEDA